MGLISAYQCLISLLQPFPALPLMAARCGLDDAAQGFLPGLVSCSAKQGVGHMLHWVGLRVFTTVI